uniref:Endonuclease/exonuclease/phosphatase domain-containing protein n=1 Tax=Aegilops tauschii subsp. strangulata TaxID=200361 RepID=A0A453EDJ8_AEGTS
MNLMFWNCGGGGNRRTVREVLALSKANSPKLVFLRETRQASEKVEKLKWRLGMRGFCGVGSDGLSGGLALFWDESLQVTVLDSCARYIDVLVDDDSNGTRWRATFVYGEPRVENRHLMWDHLSRLRAVSQVPWLVCGDFNEALWQHEHLSRSLRAEGQMTAFRDCLLVCELEDLGFSGLPFTYDNGQQGDRNVRVRLDRVCADE